MSGFYMPRFIKIWSHIGLGSALVLLIHFGDKRVWAASFKWNDIKIIDKEQCWKQRKLKKAAHILLSPKCMRQTRTELNPMWHVLLMKRGK